MAGRADVVERIAELVGHDVLQVTQADTGWPALADLAVGGASTPVAIFAGAVGRSHRGRDGVERRFQNPGSERPILSVPGRIPLLLGLWEQDALIPVKRPLLISADPLRRIGHMTRFSVFVSVATLFDALEHGWSEGRSTTEESIRCFAPALLPLSLAADLHRVVLDRAAMQAVIQGSGLLDAAEPDAPAAAERARRAGTALVRDAHFARRVLKAYGGLCAMCGLDVGLVEAAHIYPVAAPSSPDEPWNGLALCANHHLAFDKHLLGVRPAALEIVFSQKILDQVTQSAAVERLVKGTFPSLMTPPHQFDQPHVKMFEQRYAFYGESYAWLTW